MPSWGPGLGSRGELKCLNSLTTRTPALFSAKLNTCPDPYLFVQGCAWRG